MATGFEFNFHAPFELCDAMNHHICESCGDRLFEGHADICRGDLVFQINPPKGALKALTVHVGLQETVAGVVMYRCFGKTEDDNPCTAMYRTRGRMLQHLSQCQDVWL